MSVVNINTAKGLRRSDNVRSHIVCKVRQLPLIFGPLPANFISKVSFLASGCWQWLGSNNPNPKLPQHRYGTFHVKVNGKPATRYAHRVSYEACVGPIPRELEVDHICHNKLCVNPEHLQLLTHQENLARRPRVGRIPKRLGGR